MGAFSQAKIYIQRQFVVFVPGGVRKQGGGRHQQGACSGKSQAMLRRFSCLQPKFCEGQTFICVRNKINTIR